MPHHRFVKGLRLLAQPQFVDAAVRHRVAAAVEHLEAIRFCAANTLIDVGANKGQFSLAFRKINVSSPIIAFEPLPAAASVYEQLFSRDPAAQLHHVALAKNGGKAKFHVADRADSSSLLNPGIAQARAFGVHATSVIEVPVRRLDDCVRLDTLPKPILLKVDVQGAEQSVFEGCDTLDRIEFIYVELSFVELYEKQPLFQEVANYLAGRGFKIRGVFNQVVTRKFGPTQVDVLFQRETAPGLS